MQLTCIPASCRKLKALHRPISPVWLPVIKRWPSGFHWWRREGRPDSRRWHLGQQVPPTCCQSTSILTSMHVPSNHMYVSTSHHSHACAIHSRACTSHHSRACTSTHVHVHPTTHVHVHPTTHVHVHLLTGMYIPPLTCMYIPPLTCMQVIGPFCLLVTTRSNFVLMALDGCSCKPAAALTTEWYKVSG